jgi:hypothetical protein
MGDVFFNGASVKPGDIPEYVSLALVQGALPVLTFISPVFLGLKWTGIILKLNKERLFLQTCYNKNLMWRFIRT